MNDTEAARTSRTERRIQWLFAAVVLVFPLQFWFTKHVAEPYPALLLPSFEGAGLDAAGRYATELADVVVIFSDGQSRTIGLRRLFAEAPSSQFEAMSRIGLHPKAGGPPPANLWGRTALERAVPSRLVPGFVLRKTRMYYWAGVDPATVGWLRGRMRELFPERTAVRVDVVWYTQVYTWHDGRRSGERTPVDTVVVPL